MADITTAPDRTLTVTARAARRIQALATQEKTDGMMLRVAVSGGGCSGFQYGFSFDDATSGDDLVFEAHGAKVVIDDVSMDLLAGSEIDFVEDLIGSYFQINNPNASSSCGCGSSFAVG